VEQVTMKSIKIFGDSHSIYFKNTGKLNFHAPWTKALPTEVENISGSSIIGLGKARSKLNVKDIVRKSIKGNETSVFAFGQVDLELGYYYRKIIKKDINLDYESFNNELVEVYESFLKTIDSKNLIVKGVNSTVLKYQPFAVNYVSKIITENISTEEDRSLYFKTLKDTMPSFIKRNDAGISLNEKFKNMAKRNGWLYMDVNDFLTNFSLGKGVDDKFIPSGFDHHIVDSLEVRKAHFYKLRGLL
jgi:hypothetical protein